MVRDTGWQSVFVTKNTLCQLLPVAEGPLENRLLFQTGSILAAFGSIMAPLKPRKVPDERAEPRQKCAKITQQWGLEAFWTV